MEVYPNPTNHSLYINLASLNDYTYEVKSMDGKSVQKGDFLNSNQIGVSEIKTGVYILVISNDKNSISKRIIIQ